MTRKFKKTMLCMVTAVLTFGMIMPAAANDKTLQKAEYKVLTASADDTSSDAQDETASDSTTDIVDNSTTLADGSYTPDSFSFSGGTGKVKITCTSVRVEDGLAYAEIRFSSSKYGYVKANAETYYPLSTDDGSVFEIPIELNKNNKILGMTTAMSSAHEIEYTIYVYIRDAGSGQAADTAEGSESDNASIAADDSESSRSKDTAPEIVGLTASDQESVITPYLKLYYYENDITYVEIDISDTDALAEEADILEAAGAETGIYQNEILKYLIVPEDTEIPAGLEKEMIIISLPKEHIYMQSEAAEDIIETLNADSIADDIEGNYEEPDYKDMIKDSVDLVVVSSEYLRSSDDRSASETSALYNTFTDRMQTLGIPVLIDRYPDASDEEEQEAWRILYSNILAVTLTE